MHRGSGLLTDMIRQSDLVLFSLCSLATFYGMLLILSATHTVYQGTLRYVLVQASAICWGRCSIFCSPRSISSS